MLSRTRINPANNTAEYVAQGIAYITDVEGSG